MKLFIVERTDNVGYDEFDSIVVAAESEDDAIHIEPQGVWASAEHLAVQYIGEAMPLIPRGVVHASFNAG